MEVTVTFGLRSFIGGLLLSIKQEKPDGSPAMHKMSFRNDEQLRAQLRLAGLPSAIAFQDSTGPITVTTEQLRGLGLRSLDSQTAR